MEMYRPTVISIVYQRMLQKTDELRYLMVQKPLWDHEEWGLVQGAFEADLDGTFRDTAHREPSEELGTLLLGVVIDTGINIRRRFSQKTLERYPCYGYVGKEVSYFGIEFLGTEDDIHLNSELNKFRFVNKDTHLRSIKYADEVPPILAIIEQEVLHKELHKSVYISRLYQNTDTGVEIPIGK